MGAAGRLHVLLYYCVCFFFGGASFFCVFLCLFDDGVGWGGMLTFMFMLRWWCYVDHGVGWGGMSTFMFMLCWWCYVDHEVGWGGILLMTLRWSWGGVGCTQTPLKPPGASQRRSLVMFVFDMGMYNERNILWCSWLSLFVSVGLLVDGSNEVMRVIGQLPTLTGLCEGLLHPNNEQ